MALQIVFIGLIDSTMDLFNETDPISSKDSWS